ncbi:MAG: hypothetical protein KAQ81_02645, partial [Deltaproteobacteria bacterium]|nr:hypothetical protein [Deltaproteobacteria bacterium]
RYKNSEWRKWQRKNTIEEKPEYWSDGVMEMLNSKSQDSNIKRMNRWAFSSPSIYGTFRR